MKITLEELKTLGEAPEWLSNEGYSVISRGYLLPDETPKTAWERVVSGKIKSHLGEDRANRVFSYLWKGWLGLASPVFSNLNTTRGLPISCYSIHVDDSIVGIADSNKELMSLAKHGGGVGVFWGDVRSRGSLIQGGANGASEGVIPFMHIQDSVTLATNQGCYDHETEILTESGWITFPDLKNFPEIKVAQLTDKGDLSFTKYTDYIEYGVKEDLYHFTNKTRSVDLLVTGNHRMMIEKRRNVSYKRGLDGKYINRKKYFNGHLECKLAEDFKPHHDNKIWVTSKSKSGSKDTLSMLDRFLIAYQADGSTGRIKDSTGEKTGTVIHSFRFKKQRKIDRLKMILDSLEFKYSENKQTDGSTTILVRIPLSIKISKELKDVFSLDCMSKSYATEFINEVSLWDGSVCNNMMSSAITYSCVIESNVDFVQSVSVISGKMSRKKNIGRKEDSHQDRYHIYICDRDSVGGEDLTRSKVYYEGKVYCVTVPTGILIVRRNGSVAVCGNSVRRGASAAYLPIEHGDAEEFIRMRRPSGDINRQNLNIHHGVTIGDDFMRSLNDSSHKDHKKNRHLWLELLKTRLETGEPYIMFRDTVNNSIPDCYKHNNLKVETSNLCLSGDTKVLTKEFGGVRINELVGKEVTIFDGKDWVKNSSFRKTQDSARLYRIHLSDGSYVDSTKNHRWFAAPENLRVSEALNKKDGFKELTTNDLKPGMKLSFHMEESDSGSINAESAYLKGFLIAEGTRAEVSRASSEYKPLLWIYDPKKGCVDRLIKSLEETRPSDGLRSDSSFDVRVGNEWKNGRESLVGLSSRRSLLKWCDEYKSNFPQEVFSWSRESKLEFIAGLFDGDGSYMQANGGYQITSIHRSFLVELQQLLKGLGVRSTIGLMREAGFLDLNDGYGEYETKDCYRLTISSFFAYKLSNIVRFSRLSQYSLKAPNRYCADFSRVVSVEELEGTHEVYCTTVPSTTKFALANGLMTGNCSEILLHTGSNNSFVCCLSSVNLDKYDEWKNDSLFIKDCIWFLDAVIEEFIDKASSLEGFDRAVSFAKNSRALGLGVLGYHSLLQRKSLPFDSFESMMLNSQIFKKIRSESLEGSRELALVYGEPEWCKGFGIRNSHQIAIAPTATNSVISGGVSPGIEPIIANAFLQKTAKGTFLKKNPALEDVLSKYSMNDDDVWKNIAVSGGSVQHLEFLSSHEKEVFKTAYEINQVAIVKQAASRQKYVDQGQSLNIFVPHNIDPKLYHLLHMEAWKSGVKTLYYSRSTSTLSSHSVSSNINLSECKACEG